MISRKRFAAALAVILMTLGSLTAAAKQGKQNQTADAGARERAVLWTRPDDIKTRNLYYGPGGAADAPQGVCTFEKEDRKGTSPKFIVRDENGVRWKVKLGPEARPETVASRVVWAVGYRTNEDYFLPELHVEGLPDHLRRGQQFVGPNGIVRGARLKRYLPGEKKIGDWRWGGSRFTDTRELAGLRVMMALINNWDLKDDNNSIYRVKHPGGSSRAEEIYMVSDLGASFGTTGLDWTQRLSKGNLKSYRNSKFIDKVTPQYVDFNVPTRASIIHIFDLPAYIMRLRLRWIGKRVPRADVRWITQFLEQLSPQQIGDAFRAAGYSANEVDGFSGVVEKRIAELEKIRGPLAAVRYPAKSPIRASRSSSAAAN